MRIQSTGRRVTAPHFVFLLAPQEGEAADEREARLGIVVTKKVGTAAQRNRIKRVCRECFRLWPTFLPNGFDVVVIAQKDAFTLGLSDVRVEWERARPALLKRCESPAAADPANKAHRR